MAHTHIACAVDIFDSIRCAVKECYNDSVEKKMDISDWYT